MKNSKLNVAFVGRGFGKRIHDSIKNIVNVKYFSGRERNYSYDVDWAIVATDNKSHFEISKDFLKNGVNVFCEKPLTLNLKDSEELYNVAEIFGKKLYVDDIFRYHPNVLFRKKDIANSNSIKFFWRKFGTFKDTIVRNLAYHDLYLIMDILDLKSLPTPQIQHSSQDRLKFRFKCSGKDILFEYDRYYSDGVSRYIEFDGERIDIQDPPIRDMIMSVLTGEVDFNHNKLISMESQRYMESFLNKKRIAVVGGGIFGISSAISLSKDAHVDLYESNSGLLKSASSINQYRVHRGYHYPRSKETAHATNKSNDLFLKNFHCKNILPVENYYCISKTESKVSGQEYLDFLNSVGLEYEISNIPDNIIKPESIELSVKVKEFLFNPYYLITSAEEQLKQSTVKVKLNYPFEPDMIDNYDFVINATYANLNKILPDSEKILCRFELCEKPVVKLPEKYKFKSVVIMDGPFMCLDPYGHTDFHVMGNVVHAIHTANEGFFPEYPEKYNEFINRGIIPSKKIQSISKFDRFIESAKDYFFDIEDTIHIGSMFTVRTVLPNRDHDDARPTFIKKHTDKLYSIFSGKITTCVSAADELKSIIKL